MRKMPVAHPLQPSFDSAIQPQMWSNRLLPASQPQSVQRFPAISRRFTMPDVNLPDDEYCGGERTVLANAKNRCYFYLLLSR
jgi:hypothetical protein